MFHRHIIATLKDLLQQAAVIIVVGKHTMHAALESGMQAPAAGHQHKVKPSQP